MIDKIDYLRNHGFMSGSARTISRIKETGEVFTPTNIVQAMLNMLPTEIFSVDTATFMDNSCGDGQILSEVLIRKLENGGDFENALLSIYGVDLMIDNVELCRNRLLCGFEQFRYIVETNIVCADALTYDYSFTEMTEERRLTEAALRDATVVLSKKAIAKSEKDKLKAIEKAEIKAIANSNKG